jgi:hypothetical protein
VKRSEIKRTEIARGTTPLPKMSKKAKAKIPARRAAMEVVRERDQVCQFWLRLIVWAQTSGEVFFPARPNVDGKLLLEKAKEKFPVKVPDCSGPLDGHEPKHRSQGGDPTNPDEIQLVCRTHHDFCHDHPIEAKLLCL